VFLLSLTWALQMSRDVTAHAGHLCGKAAMPGASLEKDLVFSFIILDFLCQKVVTCNLKVSTAAM
jgi:hypothetical protein